MLKRAVLFSLCICLITAIGYIKLDFQATKSIDLRVNLPPSPFSSRMTSSASSNLTTVRFYVEPNNDEYPVQVYVPPNTTRQELKLFLKDKANVSKTFKFDDVEIYLTATFTFGNMTDEDSGFGIKEAMDKVSRVAQDFVHSHQRFLVTLAIVLSIIFIITCYCICCCLWQCRN